MFQTKTSSLAIGSNNTTTALKHCREITEWAVACIHVSTHKCFNRCYILNTPSNKTTKPRMSPFYTSIITITLIHPLPGTLRLFMQQRRWSSKRKTTITRRSDFPILDKQIYIMQCILFWLYHKSNWVQCKIKCSLTKIIWIILWFVFFFNLSIFSYKCSMPSYTEIVNVT